MFVEKLKKEDLIEFLTTKKLIKFDEDIKSNLFNAIEKYKVKEGEITFQIRNRRFKFIDFDYISNYTIKLYNGLHDQDWLEFMYEKFEEEYKSAFLDFREQEKKQVLEDYAKRFDEDTAKYGDL